MTAGSGTATVGTLNRKTLVVTHTLSAVTGIPQPREVVATFRNRAIPDLICPWGKARVGLAAAANSRPRARAVSTSSQCRDQSARPCRGFLN